MTVLWFIIGLIVGGGVVAAWTRTATRLQWLDWALIGIGLALWLFAISFTTTVLQEPFPGTGRAAGIGGMLLAIVALIYSVAIYRFRLIKQ